MNLMTMKEEKKKKIIKKEEKEDTTVLYINESMISIILNGSKAWPVFHLARRCSDVTQTRPIIVERSINRVTLLGRVGTEPFKKEGIMRNTYYFRLATNFLALEDGKKVSKASWHDIVVNKETLHPIVENSIRKGTRLYVSGTLIYRKFETQDGITKNLPSIIANEFIVLSQANRKQGISEDVDTGAGEIEVGGQYQEEVEEEIVPPKVHNS